MSVDMRMYAATRTGRGDEEDGAIGMSAHHGGGGVCRHPYARLFPSIGKRA